MRLTRFQVGFAVLLLAGAGTILSLQYRSSSAWREQNALLRQEVARLASENESLSNCLARLSHVSTPRLPAPQMPSVTAAAPADELPGTNSLLHQIRNGEAPRLTAAQIQRFLEENRRSVGSLLAAYRTSKDPALLREAMAKFPADPQVAFEAVFSPDTSPEARREWLENFKKAAPDNSLASYLSALDYFKAGQTDQAVQEMVAASGKQAFTDYTLDRIQADEEAFRSAGYSEAEAKMAATWGVAMPHLTELKSLTQNMVELANGYRKAGDDPSYQAAVEMAVGLGRQLDASQASGVPLISRMVGIAVERLALSSLDPGATFGSEPVQSQLDQLMQRRTALKDLVKQASPFYDQMPPQDWINYNNRTLTLGEENAMRWLLNKYAQ